METVINTTGAVLFLLGMALAMSFMLMAFTDFLRKHLRKSKKWDR